MIRFLHAADIHLDSPLRGLERYEGAPAERIRQATRHALTQLVDFAIEKSVDFVLIAGDLYDGDWRDFGTGLFFVKQMGRLRQAQIKVFLIAGNHDAANRMTRSLSLPENVHWFDSQSPSTVRLEDKAVAVHGQSFAAQAIYDDLSQAYPSAIPSMFNIGLLHTCGTGREGHDRYAPCTLEGLRGHGYDYWALGHVHQREILCEKPFIAFSGNLQGRHARETGPKGCFLVEVDHAGHVVVQFAPLDVLRWEQFRIDTGLAEDLSQIIARTADLLRSSLGSADGRLICARIVLEGTTSLHGWLHAHRQQVIEEVRAMALDLAPDDLWIEKVQLETSSLRNTHDVSLLSDDALAEMISIFDALSRDGDVLQDVGVRQEIGFDIEEVIKKLPAEVRSEEIRSWLSSAALIEQARARLLDYIHADQVAP